MLILLRIVLGFALFSVFAKAMRVAEANGQTDGVSDAGYLALAVILGIGNAIVWAPAIGRLMADPLTGAFSTGHPADFTNQGLQFVNKLAARKWRRMAVFFAFLEGVRHPDLPGAFVIGMNQARPGSWLQMAFAREVWRFDHAENCLRAWKILQARGVDPGVHRRPEVNLLILSAQREKSPDPRTIEVPKAPPPPAPRRNQRIVLFGTEGETPGRGGSRATPGSGERPRDDADRSEAARE